MVKTNKKTSTAVSARSLNALVPAPSEPVYRKGDRVQYRQFGEGTVIALEPGKLSICFDKPVGTRVLVESYVKPS